MKYFLRRPTPVQSIWRRNDQSGAVSEVKSAAADEFVDWLLSSEGQTSISDLKRDSQLLFFPTPINLWLIGSFKLPPNYLHIF